jgi:hypothetical protein
MEMHPRQEEKRKERYRKLRPGLMPTAIIIICVWILVAVSLSGYPFFS